MKTKEEIRATTGRIPRPADYQYGKKLTEWDASLLPGQEDVLSRLNPINDRIIVRLIDETPKGAIVLTDAKPLIGGMRKAVVLKCGPGKWIEGDWWKIAEPHEMPVHTVLFDGDLELNSAGWWEWSPGHRRPITVNPGQTVYIGNWVDLEAGGLCLCQEGDIRGIVDGCESFNLPGNVLVDGLSLKGMDQTSRLGQCGYAGASVERGKSSRVGTYARGKQRVADAGE